MFFDKNKSLAYAELDISGERVNPEEISQLLNIVPYKTINSGEKSNYTTKPYIVGSWIFRTEEKATEDISVQITELISAFKKKEDKLKEIKKICNCTINICIVLYNHQEYLPAFVISSEQICFLASIGAGLHFDIYHNQLK